MVKCRTTDSLCSSPNSIKIEFAIDKRSHHNSLVIEAYLHGSLIKMDKFHCIVGLKTIIQIIHLKLYSWSCFVDTIFRLITNN